MVIIEGFIWFSDIAEKIGTKHEVTLSEVENMFTRNPVFSKMQKVTSNGKIFIEL